MHHIYLHLLRVLYIAALLHFLGTLLAQHNELGKEVSFSYLSWTLGGPGHNYSPIKKLCLALIFNTKNLRHYMIAYEVQLIAQADPIRFIRNRPILKDWIGKWDVILLAFDIIYVSQKAIKGTSFG